MENDIRILPPHIEETVQAIAKVQAAHNENASRAQKAVDRTTSVIGQPRFLAFVTAFGVGWILLNLFIKALGRTPFDPPPFELMQGVLTVAAFYVAVLILATQRYAEQLAGFREQLTLELAILTEQKTSKIIELIEEIRRDNPLIHNRIDHEANALAEPANPEAVLEAIKDAHEELQTKADEVQGGESAQEPSPA